MTSTADGFLTIISLGSNAQSAHGNPAQTLKHVLATLERQLGPTFRASALYGSRPVGLGRQMWYVNAVARFHSTLPPAALLRYFKQLEREAGRRPRASGRWAARPLDIDIIDFAGRVVGWHMPKTASRPGRAPASLMLPHPLCHLRAFVLLPLSDIEPHWRHPVLGSIMQLVHALPEADIDGVTRLDRRAPACDNA